MCDCLFVYSGKITHGKRGKNMDFLQELPEIFRKRYLDIHEKYLKSISDITAYLFGPIYGDTIKDWKESCRKMILRLIPAGKLPRRKDVAHETLHFRNLRNCWYHECALHHPLYDIDSRLRFAAWKIIQCYYAVFSSIATLVCLDNTQRKSHDTVMHIYTTDFICNNNKKRFFLPPANFYLNQQGIFSDEFSKMVNWDYADEYHLPNIKECLEYTKKEIERERGNRVRNLRTGLPHYLKVLRDWANYQDAYLFFRLYGKTVKRNLDICLKRITFQHCVQTEFFMLKMFGWNALELQFKTFLGELRQNLGIESPALDDRFEVYAENIDLFKT